MKVLVLGGQGFVGQVVMRELQTKKHAAVSLSRRTGLDLTDWPTTRQAIAEQKPDAVINCAAHVGSLHYVSQYAAQVLDDNLRIVSNVFRAVAETAPQTTLIHPISNCSYPGEAERHEEPHYWDGPVHRSVWSYGNSRRLITVLADCYGAQHKLKLINFFAPNSYGPGDYTDPNKTHALNGMIIRMLQAKARGDKTFEIWGTGKPEREWIYVDDLARMLASAVDFKDTQTTPVNIAQNKAFAIGESARLIKAATGYAGELTFNTTYADGAMHKILDDKLFRKKYPDFQFTDMKTGIERTVAYYQKVLGDKK